jgi:hypothetical protein
MQVQRLLQKLLTGDGLTTPNLLATALLSANCAVCDSFVIDAFSS